jgi:hypothetical protein
MHVSAAAAAGATATGVSMSCFGACGDPVSSPLSPA